ncbi:hypothetical protein QM467_13735 [Rhodoblastus sp. 17X3]|uniref:hypothetical protein n=1 Tax=Rhodoblastus sp. 17X3 TaxID=3047026 RepID=UPI0024B66B6C|nr:hypothetical protein [Rhodoblastus sp. 17X3]MDI9849117.1 hypothetical protein [Rhodoblastus sp. 17X3]
MTVSDREEQQLSEKLEELAETLRKRRREFEETGRFSNLQHNFVRGIEKSNDALRAKVAQAARSKGVWALVKAEFWADYEAMVNEFVTLGDSADAEARKKA